MSSSETHRKLQPAMGGSKTSMEVKPVIVALCKLLSASGLSSVPEADTFRRAKVCAGAAASEQLWQLLANILQKTCPVCLEVAKQPKQELWRLVAAGLWRTGFYADWMFRGLGGGVQGEGGGQGEGGVSGRDLLLALGWLIADGALEKLLSLRVEELDKTLLTSSPGNLSECWSRVPELVAPQLEDSTLRRLQWLMGALRHQGRVLLSMQEERARLLHQVLTFDLTVDVAAGSSEGSAHIHKDCVRLQQVCVLLEAYLQWTQTESVFWAWMDSVVDQTELKSRKLAEAPDDGGRLCRCGNGGLEKLKEVLGRSQGLREDKCSDGGGAEGGGADRGGALLECLGPQPSLSCVFRARLQDPGVSPVSRARLQDPGVTHVSRARLQDPGVSRVSSARLQDPGVTHVSSARRQDPGVSRVSSARLQDPGVSRVSSARLQDPGVSRVSRARLQDPGASSDLSAARVLELLRRREAELLRRRDEQRRENRARLEEATEQLQGQLLIPP